jgi:environmental stress-induced protein Ves
MILNARVRLDEIAAPNTSKIVQARSGVPSWTQVLLPSARRPTSDQPLRTLDPATDPINMFEHARYFPSDAYLSMPWRNGAGVTREIAREPARGENFAWRLSLASLQVNGPFSSYTGYERCVALVDGRGFRLHVAGAATQTLAARGTHALFAGAAQASCELLDGPCTDLSLMVHEPGTIDGVTRLAISAEQSLADAPGKLQALFVLFGAVRCIPAGPGISDAATGQWFELKAHDTLLIRGQGRSWSIARATHEAAGLLAITFTAP